MVFRDQYDDKCQPIRVPSVDFPFGYHDGIGDVTFSAWPPRLVRPVRQRQRRVRRIREADYVTEHGRPVPENQIERNAERDEHKQFEPVHPCPVFGPAEQYVPRSGLVMQPVFDHRYHHIELVHVHNKITVCRFYSRQIRFIL